MTNTWLHLIPQMTSLGFCAHLLSLLRKGHQFLCEGNVILGHVHHMTPRSVSHPPTDTDKVTYVRLKDWSKG